MPRIGRHCSHCKKVFLRVRQARYCSDQCRLDAQNDRRRNLYSRSGLKSEFRFLNCYHCGKKFQTKKGHALFCKNACRQADYRIRMGRGQRLPS